MRGLECMYFLFWCAPRLHARLNAAAWVAANGWLVPAVVWFGTALNAG